MYRVRLPVALLILTTFVLGTGAIVTGCGSGGGPEGSNNPPPSGTLSFSINPNIVEDGPIQATTITKAELLNTSGAVLQTATISGGTAQFNLTNVAAGDYFIRVNNLADSLVPTRIPAGTQNLTQTVGQRLVETFIGPANAPLYVAHAFTQPHGDPAIVKYSDGTPATPTRYAYVIVNPNSGSQKIEVRVLGTAALLDSYTPASATHPNVSGATATDLVTWVLSENNHGVVYGGDATKCGCHGSLNSHVASYASITTGNGWCFHCHYGTGGDGSGFVDPAQ